MVQKDPPDKTLLSSFLTRDAFVRYFAGAYKELKHIQLYRVEMFISCIFHSFEVGIFDTHPISSPNSIIYWSQKYS